MTNFVHTHWAQVAAFLAATYGLLTAINGAMKDSPTKTKFGKFLDSISFLARDDAMGTFKAPGKSSVSPAALQPPVQE